MPKTPLGRQFKAPRPDQQKQSDTSVSDFLDKPTVVDFVAAAFRPGCRMADRPDDRASVFDDVAGRSPPKGQVRGQCSGLSELAQGDAARSRRLLPRQAGRVAWRTEGGHVVARPPSLTWVDYSLTCSISRNSTSRAAVPPVAG